MRIKIFVLFCLIVFLGFNLNLTAQAVTIEKSTEKVLIAGKVFFIHTIKKGETLYSIAKAYNTTVEEIITNNATANDLQVGQTIRIPDNTNKKNGQANAKIADDSSVMHVVTAGQTIYSISRIYGITPAEIEAENPEVKYDSLQINQVLKIPVEKKKTQEANYTIHKVAEKETLYSLSKKYGVSQDELVKFNSPNLNNGLKIGQEIKIPSKQQDSPKTQEQSVTSTKKIEPQQQTDQNCAIENLKIKYDTVNISLLLPLFSNGKQAQTDEDEESNETMQLKPSEEFEPTAVNFIEFYQGFMLAANELKRKGLRINVSVFDTEKDSKNIASLMEKSTAKKSNIIIGPVYTDQINIAQERIKSMNSILVSPVAQHENITKNNPKIYQVNPGLDVEYKKCIDYLFSDTSKNIILIYKSEPNSSDDAYSGFNKMLQEHQEKSGMKIRKLNVFNNDFSGLMHELDSLRENIVFSPSNDEIFVTTMFGQLDAKLILYKIHALALQQQLNYPSTDLNYFYDLQTVYFTSFYTDFKNKEIKDVLKKYRLIYGSEPVRISKFGFNYGVLGYNSAYYFISAFAYFGFEIANHSECLKKLPLEPNFSFEQIDENGGFRNVKMKKITFSKDYSLIEED